MYDLTKSDAEKGIDVYDLQNYNEIDASILKDYPTFKNAYANNKRSSLALKKSHSTNFDRSHPFDELFKELGH